MSNLDKIVLVTGATGRQGGAVIRHMLAKGWKLRALTRNLNSAAAQDLASRGIEVVQGDLEDPASLARAAGGVYGIYSVQDFRSVGGAERDSGIDHWETKWEIEKHIKKLGLPATVLRAVAFMENYYIDQV